MAKARIFPMNYCLFIILFFLQPNISNQLEISQFEALVTIKQQLNFPQTTSSWSENEDFCNSEPTQILSLACYEGNITQLHITGYISETMKLGALGLPPYRIFVPDELKEATDDFNASNLIGEGSYGQVFKGVLTDGTAVAIRSLKAKRKHGIHTYTHQMELNAKLRNSHLVSAIGHCFEFHQDDSSVNRILLMFEYVPNSTLRKYVSDAQSGQKFSWTQRIAAGIGVARGIQFLHTGIVPGVYSNHIKITDILLDHDLHVKIKKYNLPLLTGNRKSTRRFLIYLSVLVLNHAF